MGLFDDQHKEAQLLYQRLEADSVRKAWYEIILTAHPGGGFLVTKRSGPAGSAGISETWFRWSLADAVVKFQNISVKKRAKRCGRIYKEIVEPTLFQKSF